MTTNDIEPKIAARISDPGAYLTRKLTDDGSPREAVHRWAARAVVAGLRDGSLGYVPADEVEQLRAELARARDAAKEEAYRDVLEGRAIVVRAEIERQVREQLAAVDALPKTGVAR